MQNHIQHTSRNTLHFGGNTGTENQILKTVAMKNSMHYSKQKTANATRVTAALASLWQQTSHSFAIAVFRPL